MVMAGPIFLTMVKNITTAGYEGWLKNRLRGFGGRLAVQADQF